MALCLHGSISSVCVCALVHIGVHVCLICVCCLCVSGPEGMVAEVLINKELTVQPETFGSCRVTMIKNAAHTRCPGRPG